MAVSPFRGLGKKDSGAVEDVTDVGTPFARGTEVGRSRRGPLRSFSGMFTFFCYDARIFVQGHIVEC